MLCMNLSEYWTIMCCFHSNSFGPSLFLSKNKKIPISNLYGGTKGPTWNRNSSHTVFSPIIRLSGVNGSCFKTKPGISVFISTAPAAKLLSWQQHQGCHFVSFLMHIYGAKFQELPEISFIQYFPLFNCKQYDVITDLICIIEKCQSL